MTSPMLSRQGCGHDVTLTGRALADAAAMVEHERTCSRRSHVHDYGLTITAADVPSTLIEPLSRVLRTALYAIVDDWMKDATDVHAETADELAALVLHVDVAYDGRHHCPDC